MFLGGLFRRQHPSKLSHGITDYAKAIEWAADQPWSTGKVGLTGISYLGLNQVGHSRAVPSLSANV